MLTNATALTFDVVGTLIDFETGILNWWRPVLRDHGVDVTDEAVLSACAAVEAELQETRPELPYTDMLPLIYWSLSRQWGFPGSDREAASFAASIPRWPPFPDALSGMSRLASRFYLVAFTNADRWAYQHMNRALNFPFHESVTCDEVGQNKPSPRFFRYGMDKLELSTTTTAHVAQSLYHDIEPAKALGLSTVWVDRRHNQSGSGATPPVTNPVEPDLRVTDIKALNILI